MTQNQENPTCHNCNLRQLSTPATEQHKKQPTHLQCRGCGAIHLTYTPLEHQEEFHTTKQTTNPDGTIKMQIIGVFGGYGSAKSRATLQEIFLRALNNPGGTGLLTAPTLLQLKRTTIKTLLNEVIPPPLIRSYNKAEGELTLDNGFTFYLIPSDDEEKLRSLNAGLVHMEEASGISENIYTQILTRMRDHATTDKLIVVCSNPSLGWIKNVFYDNIARANPKHPEHESHNPNITTYIWKSHQNPYLPKDFIENISKGKAEWWKKRYIDGSFDQVEGAVYPQIGNAIITAQNVSDKWERVVGIDVGLRNPTAMVIGAIDEQKGEVHIFREYYKANTLVPEHAKNIKAILEDAKVTAGNTRYMVIDPAAGNKTDPINGKSIQGLYQEYGLYFQPANNNVDAGILKVNAYIELGKLKIHDTCPNLIRELQNYQYPDVEAEAKDKNLKEKPIKSHDHACFIAGTLVETINGQKPIEEIKIGDLVHTRKGYRKVYDSALTQIDAEVRTITFSNGSKLTATGNHPVWVENKGFIPVDALRYGDIINISPNWEEQVWKQKLLNGTEELGDYTQQKNTSKVIDTICIKKCGKVSTEKFQKDITFTTKTVIEKIMQLKIWNALKRLSIYQNIQKKDNQTLNTWKESDHLLLSGTDQKKEENGTEIMELKHSKTDSRCKAVVMYVISRMKRWEERKQTDFAPIVASLHGEEKAESITSNENAQLASRNLQQTSIVNKFFVENVVSSGVSNVYNISVEDAHEYYANGILVRNCDALRYLLMRLPDDPDRLKNSSHKPPDRYIIGEDEDEDGQNGATTGTKNFLSYI